MILYVAILLALVSGAVFAAFGHVHALAAGHTGWQRFHRGLFALLLLAIFTFVVIGAPVATTY